MSWLESEIKKNNLKSSVNKRSKYLYFVGGIVIAFVILFAVSFFLSPNVTPSGVKVIHLEGEVMTGTSSDSGVIASEYIGGKIRLAADDPMVKAIILRVNSGGGITAGAQEIISDVEYAKLKKPVIASIGTNGASAAYQICSHCNWIFANPDSSVGSIGSIMTFYDKSDVYDREGVEVEPVKSSGSKDAGADYRSLSDSETEHFQEMVDDAASYFLNDVLTQRPQIDAEYLKSMSAMVMRGEMGLEKGLVDELGNLYDAIKFANNYKPQSVENVNDSETTKADNISE